jgi:hypothetical protein
MVAVFAVHTVIDADPVVMVASVNWLHGYSHETCGSTSAGSSPMHSAAPYCVMHMILGNSDFQS